VAVAGWVDIFPDRGAGIRAGFRTEIASGHVCMDCCFGLVGKADPFVAACPGNLVAVSTAAVAVVADVVREVVAVDRVARRVLQVHRVQVVLDSPEEAVVHTETRTYQVVVVALQHSLGEEVRVPLDLPGHQGCLGWDPWVFLGNRAEVCYPQRAVHPMSKAVEDQYHCFQRPPRQLISPVPRYSNFAHLMFAPLLLHL